jgi:hypothetical protein
MALVIGDDLYTTAALHTKGGKRRRQRVGISTSLKQRHARNTGITKSKGKVVSKGHESCTNRVLKIAYVVPKSKDESYERKKGRKRKRTYLYR